jgi:hypothetical protein
MAGRNRKAADATIRALRGLGRLEPVDDALIAQVRSLADAVDAAPDDSRLWGQYRAALGDLREVGVDDGSADAIAELLARVRGTAEVGDPPPA